LESRFFTGCCECFRMLPKRNKTLVLLICLSGLAAAACGDDGQIRGGDSLTAKVAPPAVEETAMSDSVILEPSPYQPGSDTILIEAYGGRSGDTGKVVSPTMTMFKSVLLPGWGQAANRKYVKAGAVLIVESYFIYKWIAYARKTSDWREKWRSAPIELKGPYFAKYTDYRDTRNSFIWYTGLTVFLSMFDAYVDAHLLHFPKDILLKENVSVGFNPAGGAEMSVTY